MRALPFWKVAAAGNDFVLMDGSLLPENAPFFLLALFLCDRHWGIGADGLVLVQRVPQYDFKMEYYNADGSGPVMCGNGARAAVLFADQALHIQQEQWTFTAPDGVHQARIVNGEIQVSIRAPREIRAVQIDKGIGYLVDTGAPHLVVVANLKQFPLRAPLLRQLFDANVNFIKKLRNTDWRIRTWERGVEGETLACGTGAAAAACVLHWQRGIELPLKLRAPGGVLTVSWDSQQLWLAGPTRMIFQGTVEIKNL